jgi:transposase-like protein
MEATPVRRRRGFSGVWEHVPTGYATGRSGHSNTAGGSCIIRPMSTTQVESTVSNRHRDCPRCDLGRVIRWGRFRGIQRYRCAACGRTFSEYTATAVAYLKKRDRWPAFCAFSRVRRTVRQASAELGIHRNTAFRWRHRLLRAARTSAYRPPPFTSVPTLPLEGQIVVGDIWFLFSEKGKRPLGRPPRTSTSRSNWLNEPRVRVVLAVDDGGRVFGDLVGLRRPDVDTLEAVLRPSIGPNSVLFSRDGRFGAPSLLARRIGIPWRRYRGGGGWPAPADQAAVPAEPPPPDLPTHVRELRRWLRPLHGVATRYLANYVTWHHLTAGREPIAAIPGAEPGVGRNPHVPPVNLARTSNSSSRSRAARSKFIASAASFICSSRIRAHCSRSTSSA